MTDHIHTGVIAIGVTGIGVIALINLLRLFFAWLANIPATASVGKTLGGLVTFA